ncbi:hypothetical protein M0805_004057 [Coniferiporia weirii]|nr:hypothetical protein M0805_004057 [Coniferiporia weirii]
MLGLLITIQKFKKIENRIRAVEGGAQLMDVLVGLEEAALCRISFLITLDEDLRTALSSFRSASIALFDEFKKLGESLFKEKHLAPLYELCKFCWLSNKEDKNHFEYADIYLGLAERIVNVTKGLSGLFESSIPEFLKAQEKAQSIDYNNMLTAATFFSAVTATTLQLSYAYNTSPRASLGVAVNTLWFVALVFSTASSLNSLVGLTWYQKIRRNRLLPDWVKLWVEYGPTISLAIASAAFSAGLCLFAFSSSQHTVTSALTAAFTVAHAVALFVPLCLYSPNRLSHFLLEVFTMLHIYCNAFCLRWWYLRGVPWQDRARVAADIHLQHVPWSRSAVNSIYSVPDIVQTDTPSTRLKRNIIRAWTSVRSSAHSVVVWLTTRLPERLVGRRHRTRPIEEPSDTEQTHGTGMNFVELGELERGNGFHEDSEEPEMQIRTVTEGQGITPSEEPRTPICDNTDPDEGADLTAKKPGEEVKHSPDDTHSTPEAMKEPIVATSSTEHPIPGPSSSPMDSNSENGLEDIGEQETGARERPNAPQEREPEHPFDLPMQGVVETHGIGASNSASEVYLGREGIVEEGRHSADVRVVNPDNLK